MSPARLALVLLAISGGAVERASGGPTLAGAAGPADPTAGAGSARARRCMASQAESAVQFRGTARSRTGDPRPVALEARHAIRRRPSFARICRAMWNMGFFADIDVEPSRAFRWRDAERWAVKSSRRSAEVLIA